jgi:Pyruvate/2-oxoacid:ferredoxin oxidoreductase delta subunit
MKRNIVIIDREKCNGCGQCVSGCHEGAIQMVDGKATLVSETYCDGLGACLGECPVGAITIEEREAAEFDPKAVEAHLQKQKQPAPAPAPAIPKLACGCPGTMAKALQASTKPASAGPAGEIASELRQWPVQLQLVPINAPYWQDADILIAADCVPVAFPEFHRQMLKNRRVIIACPKLDDTANYAVKLAEIFARNSIKSVTVVKMEVPCCNGIQRIVEQALGLCGKQIPLKTITVGLECDIL